MLEVALVLEDEAPVRDVEDRGESVTAQVDLALAGGERDREARPDHHEQSRKEPPCPSRPERPESDPTRGIELGEQQRGDQVAADHEEQVDAEEPARKQRDPGVVDEDGSDRERPKPVDTPEVGQARRQPLIPSTAIVPALVGRLPSTLGCDSAIASTPSGAAPQAEPSQHTDPHLRGNHPARREGAPSRRLRLRHPRGPSRRRADVACAPARD
jgi:hypothetical protein